MYKIIIPTGEMELGPMIPFCNHYNCNITYWKQDKAYFQITSDDPINFYWLGANMNNGLLNELYAEIQNLKKQIPQ